MEIKKIIIPIAGLGTRFKPLSNVVPKEVMPLAFKPVLQYILEEARDSGINEVILVNRKNKTKTIDFFKELFPDLIFREVIQKEQLGDGDAVLQARKYVRGDACAVSFNDDIVESKVPCILQLIQAFKKYNAPIVALHRVPDEKLSSYGVVRVEKAEGNVYRIREIVEKPDKDAPSNLAIVGKYILTPKVFEILGSNPPKMKGEVRISGVLNEIAKNGELYGVEFEGKWLECGTKKTCFQTNLYLSMKEEEFKKAAEETLKNI